MIAALQMRLRFDRPATAASGSMLDPALLLAAAALLAWGLVMVASASVAVAEKSTGAPLYFFEKQLLYAGVGLTAGALAFAVPSKGWERAAPWLLILAVLLLVLVLIPGVGVKVNQARRWLDLGWFRLQTSEPARLALIMFFASAIVRRQIDLQHRLPTVLKLLLPLLGAAALILAQPDFGAAVVLVAVALIMLFVAGARLLHLLLLVAVGAAAAALLIFAADYRLRRLLSFTDPWSSINDSGWQLAQALIAIGRGEWWGVGLGSSVQKLLYLPETHTDFIFAILAEEFGLLGVAALISLFALLVARGFAIAARAERRNERFQAYLAYGLSTWIGLQALINMCVNMGLLPTKGLTLPLVSYGGSSLITVCVSLALILRVDYENRLAEAGKPAGGFRP